ncbi:MAG: hypothetical protein ACI9FW_000727 [Flavobacterium sp.]|jgi:hypothetical protein
MRIITLLFIVLFFSCSENRESNLPRIIIPEVGSIIEVNSSHMLQSQPTLLGLNFTKDTTVLNRENSYNNKSVFDLQKDTLLPKYNFKIIIDTTYDFHFNNFEYKWLDLKHKFDSLLKLNYSMREIERSLIKKVYYDKLANIRKKHVKAYPVLIYNNDINNAYIYDDFNGIQMLQEAIDIKGNWKPIEYLKNLNIGLILYQYYKLKPKKYLATSIIKYHGNFKTKIRVKIRLNNHYYYSNEIEGFINQSQFNDDFLNFKFYTIFDPNLDDEWFKIKKEYSLLKNEL